MFHEKQLEREDQNKNTDVGHKKTPVEETVIESIDENDGNDKSYVPFSMDKTIKYILLTVTTIVSLLLIIFVGCFFANGIYPSCKFELSYLLSLINTCISASAIAFIKYICDSLFNSPQGTFPNVIESALEKARKLSVDDILKKTV